MIYWLLKTIFGPFVRLVWVKEVKGKEDFPRSGACIVAANHSSYFDFIALTAVCPRRIYFLAAEKFFKSKFWRPIVEGTGQIRIDRNNSDKKEAYEKIFSVLNEGEVLGIFPEGTRSTDGQIGKTFTGVAKIALQAKSPVIPVGIKGAYEVMARHEKKPKFRKGIVIKMGKPITFEEFYGKSDDELILRQVTDKIMEEIKKLSS